MNHTHFRSIWSLIAIIASLGLLTACNDDDVAPIGYIPDTTFTGLDNLKIDYDGSQMVGKSAYFYHEGNSAVLTFYSKINPKDISSKLDFLPTVQGPGVLPGSPTLKLPVYLVNNEDNYSFSGSGETDFITYNYSGKVDNSKLDINFSDVKLKTANQGIAGTVWQPIGVISNGMTTDSLANFTFIPYGDKKLSINNLIEDVLRTLSFNNDGNIVVSYIKTADGTPQPAQCPLTMLQYVELPGERLQVYVNPTDLIGQIILNNPYHPELPDNPFGQDAKTKSEQTTPSGELQNVINSMASVFAEGVPVKYEMNGDKLLVYLDLQPILSQISELLPYVPELKPEHIAQLMPILEKVESIKLGLEFHKFQ